jgi:hypothetical protein
MNLSTTRSSIRAREFGLRVVSKQLLYTRLSNPVDALRFE